MKLICEATSFNEFKALVKMPFIGGITIGCDGLSLDTPSFSYFEIAKAAQLAHAHHIKIIINAEKLFHINDISKLLLILSSLPMREIDYFTYSDLGFYQTLVEKGYSKKLIYRAPTYLTNSSDVEIYSKLNSYVTISNQITSDELLTIVKNSSVPVIVDAFGSANCFYSKRPLIGNYLSYKNINCKYLGIVGTLTEETRTSEYRIVEDENGTRIFTDTFYYLGEEISKQSKIAYLMIHHQFLKKSQYFKVVGEYINFLSHGVLNVSELAKLNIPLSKGAYVQKTVLLKGGAVND